MGIDFELAFKNAMVGQPVCLMFAEHFTSKFGQQVHPRVHVISGSIPLEHGKLGIMQLPPFAGSKRFGHLVDRNCTGGQQSLHREFRRRLHPKLQFVTGTLALRQDRFGGNRDRFDVTVDPNVVREDRGFDFQEMPLLEKRPDFFQDCRALLKSFEGGSW